MAKLVEIAARDVQAWDDLWLDIWQMRDGTLVVRDESRYYYVLFQSEIAEDYNELPVVTRAQWEAERARIAANQKATQEAREIAQGAGKRFESADEMIKDIEQELADIACGKRSREDQALWDKVAMKAMLEYMGCEPGHIGNVTVEEFVGWGVEIADAFMAERAKRMKGGA